LRTTAELRRLKKFEHTTQDADAQGSIDKIQKVPAIEPPRQVMAEQND
jgi:hypothetical protein